MTARHTALPIVLVTVGAVCGLAATDLILPAIPVLPDVVPGTVQSAQWVLAAFALGTGAGLLIFGELGARYRIVDLLIVSLLAFAVLSLAATQAESLVQMSVIRFFQGIAASASAVYAPVMVSVLYEGPRAVAMLGRIGSIESIAPAIAPILGAVLLSAYGWQSSFYLVAATAAVLGIVWLLQPGFRKRLGRLNAARGGYLELIVNPPFMRYALSQAFTLGAVLVIVFSAPKVITAGLGGTVSDFIVMQVIGITLFITAANMTGVFDRWWGGERTILIGSAMSALGCTGLLLLSVFGEPSVIALWCLFAIVNLGLGIRGPTGFYHALKASGGNDSRGSALVILAIVLTAAVGTGAVAPWIEGGLYPLALAAAIISGASVLTLAVLAARREEPA